jgi:hypothetical protein
MLNNHADTQAYYGRMGKARDLSRRAVDSAVRADAKETGALWLTYQGLRESEVGTRPRRSKMWHEHWLWLPGVT